MKSLPTQHNLTKGLLLAAAVFSTAAIGVIASSAILGQHYPSFAFAQEELGITDTTTADNATGTTTAGDTTNATTTGGGGGNQLAGIIASLTLAPDRIAPEWVAAGYWELESDMPLLGAGTEGTQPTVTNFDAIIEMTRYADGTFLHDHTISDFRQSGVLHTDANSTTINGTATVVTETGPTENVPLFITLQNNLISIGIDPVATENHFGPTPLSGIILTPEHLQEISNRLTPTAAAEGTGGGAGTETTIGQPQGDSAAMTTDTIGNTTG
jgi:hypothetical protein